MFVVVFEVAIVPEGGEHAFVAHILAERLHLFGRQRPIIEETRHSRAKGVGPEIGHACRSGCGLKNVANGFGGSQGIKFDRLVAELGLEGGFRNERSVVIRSERSQFVDPFDHDVNRTGFAGGHLV